MRACRVEAQTVSMAERRAMPQARDGARHGIKVRDLGRPFVAVHPSAANEGNDNRVHRGHAYHRI